MGGSSKTKKTSVTTLARQEVLERCRAEYSSLGLFPCTNQQRACFEQWSPLTISKDSLVADHAAWKLKVEKRIEDYSKTHEREEIIFNFGLTQLEVDAAVVPKMKLGKGRPKKHALSFNERRAEARRLKRVAKENAKEAEKTKKLKIKQGLLGYQS